MPVKIICDQGSEFMSLATAKLMEQFKCVLAPHDSYSHHMSGAVERFNGTLINILRHYLDRYQKNWDDMLPYALFAYRTAKQAKLRCSPFRMLYGRDAVAPGALSMGAIELEDACVGPVLHPWKELAAVQALQEEDISKDVQAKAKVVADAVRPGQYVYVKLTERGKLDARFSSKPYKVVTVSYPSVSYEDHLGNVVQAHISRVKVAVGNVPVAVVGNAKKK
jgi:hypothetical protein